MEQPSSGAGRLQRSRVRCAVCVGVRITRSSIQVQREVQCQCVGVFTPHEREREREGSNGSACAFCCSSSSASSTLIQMFKCLRIATTAHHSQLSAQARIASPTQRRSNQSDPTALAAMSQLVDLNDHGRKRKARQQHSAAIQADSDAESLNEAIAVGHPSHTPSVCFTVR